MNLLPRRAPLSPHKLAGTNAGIFLLFLTLSLWTGMLSWIPASVPVRLLAAAALTLLVYALSWIAAHLAPHLWGSDMARAGAAALGEQPDPPALPNPPAPRWHRLYLALVAGSEPPPPPNRPCGCPAGRDNHWSAGAPLTRKHSLPLLLFPAAPLRLP